MKQKLHKMNTVEKKKMVKGKAWMIVSSTAIALGLFAFSNKEVSAAESEWIARTPEQIIILDRSEYKIVLGDTLWAISEASDLSIDTLVKINSITNRELIYAGNTVVIDGDIITVTEQNGQQSSYRIDGEKVEATDEIAVVNETTGLILPVKTEQQLGNENISEAIVMESELEAYKIIEYENDISPAVPKKSESDVISENPVIQNPVQSLEEIPEKDGYITEDEEVIDEKIVSGNSEIPSEGSVEDETTGEPITEIIDESESVTPGTPTIPAVPGKPEVPGTGDTVTTTKMYTITTPLLPGVENRNDLEMAVGETRTVEGIAGQLIETFKQVTENDVVLSDVLVNSKRTASIPTIVYHGTKTADVVRVTKKHSVSTVIEFGKNVRENTDLAVGETEVVQKGVNGLRVEIYNQYFENDALMSEKLIDTILTESIPEIIEVGTKNVSQVPDVSVTYSNDLAEGEELDTADVPYMNLSDEEIYKRATDSSLVNREYREFMTGDEKVEGITIEIFTERDIEAINNGEVIDEVLLNEYFLEILNAERIRQGHYELISDNTLAEGTDARAEELAEAGTIRPLDPGTGKAPVDSYGNALTHYRPYDEETGYESFYTAFDYRNDEPEYYVGENLAARTYTGNPYELNSEQLLAEIFFIQWRNSASHYDNMMADVYTGTWISIKVGSDVKFLSNSLLEEYYDSIIGVQILATDSK